MLDAIKPVTREWAHSFVEPFLEGAERINRAWKGVHLHSLERAPLSLKERITSFVIGLLLLLPLINTIIWIAWQTFGKPEKLSAPFAPEEEAPPVIVPEPVNEPAPAPVPALAEVPAQEPAAPQAAAAPVAAAAAGRQEIQFSFNEMGPGVLRHVNWRIETQPNLITTRAGCAEYDTTGSYDANGNLTEFHHTKRREHSQFDVLRRGNQLDVHLVKDGQEINKTLTLTENIPWIQQPTLALKNFARDANLAEFRFYSVIPKLPRWLAAILRWIPNGDEVPFILSFVARKVRLEDVPEYGRLLRIEAIPERRPYNQKKGILFFDPQTGDLRKFINEFENETGEFVLPGQQPAPAHP